MNVDAYLRGRYAGHIERLPGHGSSGHHRVKRVGVMLHYDASASDAGSVAWFRHPGAKYAGYHYIVQDDGTYFTMGPPNAGPDAAYDQRMYHAGKGRPSRDFIDHGEPYPVNNGNGALIGISISAGPGDHATPIQLLTVAALTLSVFGREGWDPVTEIWRVTGHEDETSRKIDPTGPDPNDPVMSKADVRFLVQKLHIQRKAAAA